MSESQPLPRPIDIAQAVIDWTRTERGATVCLGIAEGQRWAEIELFHVVTDCVRSPSAAA